MKITIQSISDKGTSKAQELDLTGIKTQRALSDAIDKKLAQMSDDEFAESVEMLDAYHDYQEAQQEEE